MVCSVPAGATKTAGVSLYAVIMGRPCMLYMGRCCELGLHTMPHSDGKYAPAVSLNKTD